MLLLLAGSAALAGEPCLVHLDGSAPLGEALERCALEAAERQVEAPDRFESLSYRFGGADSVKGSILRVTVAAADGPNQAGIVQLTLRLEGDTIGQARASVRGTVNGPALVPVRHLQRSRPIDPDALEMRDLDLTRLAEEPLRSTEGLAEWVPLRTLSAGRPLTPSLLAPRPLVRKGDVVALQVQRGSLTVSAQGLAFADGSAGQTIPVENTGNGARLLAQVQTDGSLQVVRGPQRSRR
ncbi:hypothetical protein ABI59_14660 [Acidobacteria bacterium Mor1]|nr:hypothetical protein ABI59_14660 [Acidobacteria bacterium Mor1]